MSPRQKNPAGETSDKTVSVNPRSLRPPPECRFSRLPDLWSGIESLATSRGALWFVFADRHQTYHIAKAPLAGGPAVEVPGPFGVSAVVADAKTAYFVALKDAKNKYVGAIGP